MKTIKLLLFTIAIVLLIQIFAFTSYTIPFTGMENSLFQGDRIIVNKWSYGLRTPFMGLFGYHRIMDSPLEKNDIVVFNNPLSTSAHTSTDRKEIFISRCIGLPGDTLMLDEHLTVTAQIVQSPNYKSLYAYPKEQEDSLILLLQKINIPNNELISYRENEFIRSFSHYEAYLIKQKSDNKITLTAIENEIRENTHLFVVPNRGQTIKVYPWNARLLKTAISHHEGKSADICDEKLLVNGQETETYTFTKDYYWMVSNNSVNMNDSRSFGLVPKDHIIGRAMLIWFSKKPDTTIFEGYRLDRFFNSVK